MATQAQKNWAIRMLQNRAKELGRPPTKADFDDAHRARIKSFLGPWPRALEVAELKQPKKQVSLSSKG